MNNDRKLLEQALKLIEGEWPEGDEIAQPVVDAIREALADHSGDGNEMVAEQEKQEPVAEMFLGGITDGEYGEYEVDPYQRVIEALQKRLVKDGNAVRLELYAAPVDAKAIRAEALEEAAKWFEGKVGQADLRDIAAAIRSMK